MLVAGGSNKGLDLSVLAEGVDRLRAVVAIGDAAGEVQATFAGRRPVVVAGSMRDAVAAAAELARPGDAVLLSPACASFDWYEGYGARGDDFVAEVQRLRAASSGDRAVVSRSSRGGDAGRARPGRASAPGGRSRTSGGKASVRPLRPTRGTATATLDRRTSTRSGSRTRPAPRGHRLLGGPAGRRSPTFVMLLAWWWCST